MDIRMVLQDTAAEVTLRGDLVADTAVQVEQRLTELIEQGVIRIVLNLRSVHFIDSSGLKVVIGAHKKLGARQGRLILLAPTGPAERFLRITGADKKVAIAATQEEVLSLLQGEPS